MFCPGCGKTTPVDLKFCRSCGMNLEQTALSVLEQFPNDARVALKRQERLLQTFGNIAFTGFGIVIGIAVLGIIYAILTKFVLNGTQPWAGILMIAFIVFAGLTLGYVLWSESLKERRQKLDDLRRSEIGGPDQNVLADKPFEPVPSVTERTTSLLEHERRNNDPL